MKQVLFLLSSLWLLTACQPAGPELLSPHLLADGRYRWQQGGLETTLSPARGGRLMSYRWQGQEMLVQPGDDPWAYGSTCWPAPHNWGWPPPLEVDDMAYEAHLSGDTLHLRGPVITKMGLQIEKAVWVEKASLQLHFRYQIYNRADSAQSVAAWEVTRQPKGGIARCRIDTSSLPYRSLAGVGEQSLSADGHYQVAIPAGYAGPSQKVSFDGAEGWISYTLGGVALRKQAPEIPVDRLAPRGGQLEIYVDDNSDYVEIEIQGPYQRLAPGEAAVLETTWEVKASQ